MEYFGLTDKGRVRPTNQDIFQIEAREDNRTALLVVCDGMGGANAGNVASRFAAQSFMHQISEDHSYVEEMRRRGKITEADARTHPQKNLITRAVGVEPYVEGDLFEVRLTEKDMLLLCSDGLTGMTEDSRIAEVLSNAPTLELAGDALLQLALDGGGRDNITVALFTLGKKQGA